MTNHPKDDDNLDIPSFLKRQPQAEKQEEANMAQSNVTEATPKPQGKPPVKAAGKPKAAAGTKASKAAKPVTDKPPKAGKPTAKFDQYGFREGTLKSKAAAMYAAKGGATLYEVKKALGSVQLNVLTELKKAGHTVEQTKVNGAGNRDVTRYHLVK